MISSRNFVTKIDLLPAQAQDNHEEVWQKRLIVFAGATGKIRSTSGHMCSRATKNAACTLRQNYKGDGVGIPTKLTGKTVPECCAACAAHKGCAVFVFLPGNVPTCTLYPATGSNGKTVTGAVTGTPQR
jgi:hypothetical protein